MVCLGRGSARKIQIQHVSSEQAAKVLPSSRSPFHRPALVVTLVLWGGAVNEEPVFCDEVEARGLVEKRAVGFPHHMRQVGVHHTGQLGGAAWFHQHILIVLKRH